MKVFIGSVLLLLALAYPRNALAAELYGQVLDKNGRPAGNVEITIKDQSGNVIQAAQTNPNGSYSVDLPPRDYTLVIDNQPFSVHVFKEKTRKDLRLK